MAGETYPGTDLLIRLCYGCDEPIEQIFDLWVDFDSNCCICTKCRDLAWLEGHYPSYKAFTLSIVPASRLDYDDINEMREG